MEMQMGMISADFNSVSLPGRSRWSSPERILSLETCGWFTKHVFVRYKNNDNFIWLLSLCVSKHVPLWKKVKRVYFKLYIVGVSGFILVMLNDDFSYVK